MTDAANRPVSPLSQGRETEEFQKALTGWFRREGRSYPWRETTDPYAILVSEFMLQQTRIETVLGKGYYSRWLKRFPDWATLADAAEEEILKAWEGLGYYNRARNLQKAARAVVEEHGGRFPDTMEKILSLPGVGRYTAGAVFSFAFDRPAPIVDGNVIRVLTRLGAYRDPVDTGDAKRLLWQWAGDLTPRSGARDYNSGMMELGQRICLRSSPRCDACPVQEWCRASEEGKVAEIPVKKSKARAILREESVAIVVSDGRIFLSREEGTRRKGLWRLPEVEREVAADLVELFRFDYAITKYRVTLRVYELPSPAPGLASPSLEGAWFPLHEDRKWPAMGSPYRKAIDRYRTSVPR